MNRYSVTQTGAESACNWLCESIGDVFDKTLDALKRGDKVTIAEIPPELIDVTEITPILKPESLQIVDEKGN